MTFGSSCFIFTFSLKEIERPHLHHVIGFTWFPHYAVPHFEKMLYDQGQIANVYLDTFSITRDTFYTSVARDILDYLRRDMIGDAGEIYSAEDADSAEYHGASRKKEGAFYVWTNQEVCLFLNSY